MVAKVLSMGTESRKVAVFMVVWVAATTLLWFGKLDTMGWIDLTKWGFAALAAGLSAEHFADKTSA